MQGKGEKARVRGKKRKGAKRAKRALPLHGCYSPVPSLFE